MDSSKRRRLGGEHIMVAKVVENIEALTKWLEEHAKDGSPNSQTIFASVLRKMEELELK